MNLRIFAVALGAAVFFALPALAQETKLGTASPGDDGLMLRRPQQPKTLFDWSWTQSEPAGVPRLSGLALTWPGGLDGGTAGSGLGLDMRRAFALWGEDVGLSIGAGVAPRPADSASSLAGAGTQGDQAGFGGRVRIRSVSLGGAFIGSRASTGWGDQRQLAGGHDIDLSYSFPEGSVSLAHIGGQSSDRLMPWTDSGRDRVALSGRYLLGPGLDMTGLFAVGGGNGDPVQSAFDGFALTAGVRLSF